MIKSPDAIAPDKYWLQALRHRRIRSGMVLRLKKVFFVSLVVHAILLSVFLFTFRPSATTAKLAPDSHYMVDLVRNVDSPSRTQQRSLPEEIKEPPKEKEIAIPKPKTEKPPPVPVTKDKTPPQPKVDDVDKAIEDIRKRLAAATPSGSQASSPATSQGRTAREEAAMHDYYQTIWSIVRANWAFPDDLLQGRNLLTVVRVRVMRNGEVRDLSFEQRSSFTSFDESVMNAIKKASPFPPLPREISGSNIELGIRFHSSQLVGG